MGMANSYFSEGWLEGTTTGKANTIGRFAIFFRGHSSLCLGWECWAVWWEKGAQRRWLKVGTAQLWHRCGELLNFRGVASFYSLYTTSHFHVVHFLISYVYIIFTFFVREYWYWLVVGKQASKQACLLLFIIFS